MIVSVIGVGVVGSAISNLVKMAGMTVNEFDPKLPGYKPENLCGAGIYESDFVFLCLPTPTVNGEQDLKPIEETLGLVNKDNKDTIYILKSTVLPGTTDRMVEKYGLNIVHSPEFLSEITAKEDFYDQNIHFMGFSGGNSTLEEIQRHNQLNKIQKLYNKMYSVCGVCKKPTIEKVKATESEMIKYTANCFYATKVTFFNEIERLCREVGADYKTVSSSAINSKGWIAKNHYNVPGRHGAGYSGMCLVPGTSVSTPHGISKIEDIVSGSVIDDISGITFPSMTGNRYVEKTIKITSRGRPIEGSEDHIQIVYDLKKDKKIEKNLKEVCIGDWVCVPKLKFSGEEYLIMGPQPNNYVKWWPEKVSLNFNIGRLFGLFLSEGTMCNDLTYSTVWNVGERDEFLADEVVDILEGMGLRTSKEMNVTNGTYGEPRCWLVRVRSAGLQHLFKKLGSGRTSYKKNVNPRRYNKEFYEGALSGWLDGDGNVDMSSISGYSRSTALIKSMDSILLGLGVNAYITKKGEQINISTRRDVTYVSSLTSRLKCFFKYKRDKSYGSPTMKELGDFWITKVTKKEENEGRALVCSIETKSGTYIANNVLTHNCFPKDMKALSKLSSFIKFVDDFNNKIRGDNG